VDTHFPTQPATTPSQDERNWGLAAHLSALVAVAGIPFGHIIGPLLVLLIKGKESAFVAGHARASLNYQLTLSLVVIVAIVAGIAFFVAFAGAAGAAPHHRHVANEEPPIAVLILWLGIIAGFIVFSVGSLIFIVMGTFAASAGRPYTYPFAIPFVRA